MVVLPILIDYVVQSLVVVVVVVNSLQKAKGVLHEGHGIP